MECAFHLVCFQRERCGGFYAKQDLEEAYILSCLCVEQGLRKLRSSDLHSLAHKNARLTPCFSQPFQMVLARSRASTDFQQQRERDAPLGDCVELVEELLVEVSQLASMLD